MSSLPKRSNDTTSNDDSTAALDAVNVTEEPERSLSSSSNRRSIGDTVTENVLPPITTTSTTTTKIFADRMTTNTNTINTTNQGSSKKGKSGVTTKVKDRPDAATTPGTYSTVDTHATSTTEQITVATDNENRGVVERCAKKQKSSDDDDDDDVESTPDDIAFDSNMAISSPSTGTKSIAEEASNGFTRTGEDSSTLLTTMSTHSEQPRRPSYAPSIHEYIHQIPTQSNGTNGSCNNGIAAADVQYTYLPRPEWCMGGIVGAMMRWVMVVKNPFCDLELTHSMDQSESDGNKFFYQYVAASSISPSSRFDHSSIKIFGSDDDDEDEDEDTMSDASDNDEDEEEDTMLDDSEEEEEEKEEEESGMDSDIEDESMCDNSDEEGESYDENDEDDRNYKKKKMAFKKKFLVSYTIHFDVNDYMWKLQRINSSTSSNTTSFPDGQYQFTFDTLIKRQRGETQENIDDFMSDNTILHQAIREDATDIAINIVRMEYNSFLYCVSRDDSLVDSVGLMTMLENSNLRMTPLIIAAQKGNVKVIEELLNCGVSIHGHSKSSIASWQPTAIFQAALYGQINAIECIIDYYQSHHVTRCIGPNSQIWPTTLQELINKPNDKHTTPLMCAAQKGHVSIVKLLLKHDAGCDYQNDFGMSALMFAAQHGHVELCRLLIEHEADMNLQSREKSTALFLASKRGHVAVVKELVVSGCELYHTNRQDFTARAWMELEIHNSHHVPRPDPNRPNNHPPANTTRQVHDGPHLEDSESFEENFDVVPSVNYLKIAHMLDPQIQLELKRLSIGSKRNDEIVRLYTLLHQNRADIKTADGGTYDVPTAMQSLATSTTQPNTLGDTIPSTECPKHDELSKLPRSSQMLIHTMMLPMPLLKHIVLFLPLPTLWPERLEQLEELSIQQNPNEAVVYTLDLIDEIMEEGGFLLACDAAQIPAPIPHQTWCDWKRSAKPICSSLDDEQWILTNDDPFEETGLSITTSLPPTPRDQKNPTICESRRLVGYSTILSQYKFQTNILSILSEEPYGVEKPTQS